MFSSFTTYSVFTIKYKFPSKTNILKIIYRALVLVVYLSFQVNIGNWLIIWRQRQLHRLIKFLFLTYELQLELSYDG